MKRIGICGDERMEYTRLKEINKYISSSINPAKTPDSLFEVYSVPSYETGHPEYLHGSEIASNKIIVKKDDILLCKINPRINRVWVVADESKNQNIASSEWIVIRNSQYNPEFLAWYFRTPKFKQLMVSEVAGIGGSLTRAQPKAVAEYPVPVLNRVDQDAIAATLNCVNAIIKYRQQQLKKLDELVKARFVELFVNNEAVSDWPYYTIAAVSKEMRTGPFGSALHHDEFVDSGVFVLGIDNAVENKFSYNRMRYITEEKYQQLKRYTVYPGDVIITIMGTVGRSAVVPPDMPKAINTKHLACITPDTEKVDAYFLSCAFQIHPDIRMQLQRQCKGAIMDGLNLTVIKGLSFPIPPIDWQRQFVKFYEQIDKSKAAVQKALDEAQLLFDSLMQKYFG